MDSAKNATRDLAVRLLGYRQEEGQGRTELTTATQNAFDKMNVHFSRRLGGEGYRALLMRAISLATTDFPWLSAIHVNHYGVLNGFNEVSEAQSLPDAAQAIVAVLSAFIGLLEAFVGRDLSARLLSHCMAGDDSGGLPQSGGKQ